MQRISEPRLYRTITVHDSPAPLAPASDLWIVLYLIILTLAMVGLYYLTGESLSGVSLAMAYFVHVPGTDPTFGAGPFDTRAEAHLHARTYPSKHDIAFRISDEERENWRAREEQRFYSREYSPVPWGKEDGTISPWAFTYGPVDPIYLRIRDHYAHLSTKKPGMVAYTPSEEDGHLDRQVAIRTGRYLEQFMPEWSKDIRDDYIERIKVLTEGYKLARTEEEIIAVYSNGPSSCMSHPLDDYESNPIHPCAVYGESDLAVAYLGSLDSVRARCVVWPEKKRACRNYGDSSLRAMLTGDGYTFKSHDSLDYGSLHGAKVRAILHPRRERWVMPYVDGANTADLTEVNGVQWFTLRADHEGDYLVRDSNLVDGFCSENRTVQRCGGCNDRIGDYETYCNSCNDRRSTCQRCESSEWDENGRTIDGEFYCDYCASNYAYDCDGCSEEFMRTSRSDSYCDSCTDHYTACDECEEMFDTREVEAHNFTRDLCVGCLDMIREEAEEERRERAEGIIRVRPVPVVTPFIPIRNSSGTILRHAEVVYRAGTLVVHVDTMRDGYSITHTLSGLHAQYFTTEEEAIQAARALYAYDPHAWQFTTPYAPPDTVTAFRTVRNAGWRVPTIEEDVPTPPAPPVDACPCEYCTRAREVREDQYRPSAAPIAREEVSHA